MNNSSQVHIGSNGYLFLQGGKHTVFNLFSAKNPVSHDSLKLFWDNYNARSIFCSDRNINYMHLIFPEKAVALKPYIIHPLKPMIRSLYTHHYRTYLKSLAVQVASIDNMLYPLNVLKACSGYLKTDTHLSASGCLHVARLIVCRFFRHIDHVSWVSLLPEMDEMAYRKHPSFIGDLGRMLHEETGAEISEQAQTINLKPKKIQMETNGLSKGNDGTIDLVHCNNSITDYSLLIFGDSFMRQILPLLAFYFKKIVFIRSRYFHYEVVSAFNPSHIITSTAERYLSRVFSDSIRPHFLTYPLLKGISISPTDGFSDLWSNFIAQPELLRNF